MRPVFLAAILAAALAAQQKAKQAPPPNPLAELEAMGAVIARAVEFKDWPAVLRFAPAQFQADRAEELRNPQSDFYCFLVDANCNPNWQGRTSVFHLLSRAHSLGVAAIQVGPNPPQAAILYFYDRSEIPLSSLRSEQWRCKEGGWRKVAFWSFVRRDGKWVAEGPVFDYATDSFCPYE